MQTSYNILVIGNGFDLAHSLPTTYNDFLEFGERVRRIFTIDSAKDAKQYEHSNLDGWEMDIAIKGILYAAFESRQMVSLIAHNEKTECMITKNASINELYDLINDNAWFVFFLNRRSYIGDNWIDFEQEMSKVIQALDSFRFQVEFGGPIEGITKKEEIILKEIRDCSKAIYVNAYSNLQNIDEFALYLYEELNKLIRAIEIYIAEFVGQININKKSPDIENLIIDHVLSFNYSDTFEKVYGKNMNIDYDYIHGEASISNTVDSNNMVLGIDEYLDDERKNKAVEFIAFKKFFQRIYKQRTMQVVTWCSEIKQNNEYLQNSRRFLLEKQIDYELATDRSSLAYNWQTFEDSEEKRLKEFEEKHEKHKLYIFGHSLDVTDKDILRDLILNDNVETTIYYYSKDGRDKSDLRRKLANLAKVIGEDELKKRTGGNNKTITFEMQKDMVEL